MTQKEITGKFILNIFTLSFLCIILNSAAIDAQTANMDWKMTQKSAVRQVITNCGELLGHPLEFNYPGMLNCEFPANSFEEHHGEGGIWIGAITPSNDTLVTSTLSWAGAPFWETYPSGEPWDTIWVVNRGEKADIPYWPGYTGLSDQDLVMRYTDYGPVSLKDQRHNPLYLEIIQYTYTYSSPDALSEILIHNYKVISKKYDLKSVHVGLWLDPNVGDIRNGSNFLDDYSLYYKDLKLAMGVDAPGGTDGTAYSPIAIMAIPPKGVNESLLRWTWKWGDNPFAPGMIPPKDGDKFRQLLANGTIMENQQLPTGSHFVLAFGPFSINAGDTLTFSMAEIFGKGVQGVLKNAEMVKYLIKKNFLVPSAPPVPPLVVKTDNKSVKLSWTPTASVNPENYTDAGRADGNGKPFEGYRVYKSTASINGPWTLLAEYDIPDNSYGNNLGLKYEYKEDFLLNNVEYYYSVTSFSKEDTLLNWPSLESSISANAKVVVPGTAAPETVGEVAVVPNPYRGDIDYSKYNPAWERPDATRGRWMEQDRRIQFINLPSECEIKIYTLAGELVQTLDHHDATRGYEDWNLTSSVGQAIASDLYLFTVRDLKNGKVQVGKFVVIK